MAGTTGGRPTLQQLVYFLAAVEHRSFAAAALAHYIAQPSLSDQVRRLETTLGVTLFTRTNRALQLTDAGRMLVPWAEKVLRDVDDLTAAVRDVRELAGGTVSFGTFSSAHLYLLPGLTAEFGRRHPDVAIRVQGLNSSEVADAVRPAWPLHPGFQQLILAQQRTLLHAGDQRRVLGVDLPVHPPVQVARRAHLAPVVW